MSFFLPPYDPPATATMPSATGENWEKYRKNFDEDETDKKITPLTDE